MAKSSGLKGDQGDKERRWRQEISAWRGSGERQSEYCRRRGLKRDQFVYWKRRVEELHGARRDAAIELVEVPAAGKTVKPLKAGVALISASGWSIELEPGFDEPTLSRAVAVLEGSR